MTPLKWIKKILIQINSYNVHFPFQTPKKKRVKKCAREYKINFSSECVSETIINQAWSVARSSLGFYCCHHSSFVATINYAWDHVVIIIIGRYIQAMRQNHYYYSGPVEEKKRERILFLYWEEAEDEWRRRISHLTTAAEKKEPLKEECYRCMEKNLVLAVLVSEFQH